MGYFSNGTEAEIYENEYCRKCVHYYKDDGIDPCAIMAAHVFYQDVDCWRDCAEEILDMLIPREGAHNGQCTLFYEEKRNES
jgi:hypothetical protein